MLKTSLPTIKTATRSTTKNKNQKFSRLFNSLLKKTIFIYFFALLIDILAPGAIPNIPVAWAQTDLFSTGSANVDVVSIVAIPPKKGDEGELLRLKPGGKIQTTIRVRNTSAKTLTLESFVKDFIVAEDGFTPVVVTEDVSNRWSLADWMTITPNVHTLNPGELGQINVLIEAPADALPGGHYAMVLHQPNNGVNQKAGDPQQNSNTAINQQVGTLFYVVVEGPIKEQAFIQNFSFKNFSEFGPVPFYYQVDNQSDVHIKAQARIDIYNMLGVKVGTITPEAKNIFPLMSRAFEGTWDKKWGLGQYTAKLSVAYGNSGQITLANTKFWILPIRLILTITISFLFIVIIIIMIRNKKNSGQNQNKRIKELEIQLKELERQNTTQT